MTPPCPRDLREGKCDRCGKLICFIAIRLCEECMEIITQENNKEAEAISNSTKN